MNKKLLFCLCVLVMSFSTFSTAVADVTITGKDSPDDKGSSISLSWTIEGEETLKKAVNVHVFRKEGETGAFSEVKVLPASTTSYGDKKDVKNRTPYFYYLLFKDEGEKGVLKSEVFGPYESYPQWFKSKKKVTLFFAIVSMTIILLFINFARRGKKLYIRPLAGVKAIEDAVGRAAEMGKPCVYSPGISVIDDISTLASISILAKVSQVVAEYSSRLVVPNYDPIVYSVTDEVVKNAYVKSGRPDAYRPEDVYFLTNRQFAYASGISGLMAREKPAANFFLGYFMAESLILAEAGSMTGAVQIAGTDSISQIPFFIVACDYTLIGEELYAAGAYMGHDAQLLGSLKGQDYVKLVLMITLVLLFFLKLFGVEGIDTLLLGGK